MRQHGRMGLGALDELLMDRGPCTDAESRKRPYERHDRGSVVRHTLIAIGLVALALLLWQIAHILLLGFGGIVLAVGFRAAGRPIARLSGMPTSRATGLVIIAIALLIVGGGWMFGQHIGGQFDALRQSLVDSYERVRELLGKTQYGEALLDQFRTGLENLFEPIASGAVSLVSGLFEAFVVLAAAVFLALAPEPYRNGLRALVPPHRRPRIDHAIDAAGSALRHWLLGQGMAMLGVAIATGIGLWLVGVPMPFALAVVAGLLDFIPFFGAILGAVPGVLIAFQVSPQTALYAALVYLVVQQIEGNVLQPLAQRWAVQLPPALGILAVLAFALLFGVLGALVAVPLTVVAMVLAKKLYVEPMEAGAAESSRHEEAQLDTRTG